MGRKKISSENSSELLPINPAIEELFKDAENSDSLPMILSYIPSFFTTASLPFKNVHKTVFIRKGSDGVTLTLSSPKNVPFGKYGRLLLSVLTTHAVLSKEKGIPVLIEYKNLAELLRELQLPKQRGKEIREQLECFSNASFSFEQKIRELRSAYLFKDLYTEKDCPTGDVQVTTKTTGNIRFTNGVQFQEIDDGSEDKNYGNFKIVLSPEFVALCQKHAVPINYSVYKEISSPIGKDMYAWLIYRNNAINEPVYIPRQKLVDQFCPVSSEDPFQKNKLTSNNYYKLVDILKEIKEKWYPELKISFDPEGLGITLYKSPTPVLKNDVRYALITSDL